MSADDDNAVPASPIGSLMPVGSIVAYAGNADDSLVRSDLKNEGWLVCDGTWVLQQDYPFLFDRIKYLYGTGGSAGQFRLPDYRGRFLRGVSGDSGRDPNVNERTPSGDGSRVGVASYQPYATAEPRYFSILPGGDHIHPNPAPHQHLAAQYKWESGRPPKEKAQMVVAIVPETLYPPGVIVNQNSLTTGTDGGHNHGPADDHRHDTAGFDDESRPINIYVYWLIKYA